MTHVCYQLKTVMFSVYIQIFVTASMTASESYNNNFPFFTLASVFGFFSVSSVRQK